MSDPYQQRNLARQIEQARVIERPGGITGFDTFYAQGTFVPTYQGSGTAGTWAYSTQTGFYTRIGNRCFFNLSLGASSRSVAPTGNARIIGLPFTSDATADSHSPVALDTLNSLTLTGTIVQMTARIPASASLIEFFEILGTAPSAVSAFAATGLGTTPFIRVSGSYMV